MKTLKTAIFILFLLFFPFSSRAEKELYPFATYTLEISKKTLSIAGQIGEVRRYIVQEEETLLDIARKFDLGFSELLDANPGIDPWVPPVGSSILLPCCWILPEADFKGIVINIPERRLYYILPGTSQMVTFPLGIGMNDWQTPVKKCVITEKKTDPVWTIPSSIKKELANPPDTVPPGPDNPIGKYFLRLSGEGYYAIHGTNNPWGIGRSVTHGCIRLYPENIPFLFEKTKVGTPVEIVYQPVKIFQGKHGLYLEVHRDTYNKIPCLLRHAIALLRRKNLINLVDRKKVREITSLQSGIPRKISGEHHSPGILSPDPIKSD